MTTCDAEHCWDLSPLYLGPDDPALEADFGQTRELARHFRRDFRGRLDSDRLSPELLVAALGRYEEIQRRGLNPYLFAQLLFAADSRSAAHKALLARARETWGAAAEDVLFFELELLRLDEECFVALLRDPEVARYGHYLIQLRAHTPYALAEDVEQALKRKDLSGREAFVQLFDELTSSLRFTFTFPGEDEPRETSGEELLALLYHPDRIIREDSFGTFLEGHARNALVLTTCFNNILLDHGKEAELRRYPELMTPTHLACETEPETVERMLTVTEANYSLAQEYFRLKGKLLGLDRLKNTDLYAPIGEVERHFSLNEARDLVLDAFSGFSPQMAEAAGAFFTGRRIDAAPRPGKSGGAFCMGMLPGLAPYVLLNFTGTLRDVSTLAHELGHGVHFALSQKQHLFHYHAPLPLAETASVFGEMLLTRHLLARESDPRIKTDLLCAKIEEIIATTFRQTVLTRFEQKVHAVRGERLLAAEDFCSFWQQENARLFGGAVEMIEPYRWGWSYIGHFIHARFYCYSYVFGELLVLALYRKYQEEGAAFVPKYLELLAAGGSRPPRELLAPLGINLADPDFWQKGYDVVRDLLAELREIAGQ